ncbi:MAG: PLP-dependent aspartate aminotransferase family protein [Pseudomonadota bacterium]
MTSEKRSTETLVAQGMHYIDPTTGGVVPPLQPSTTFARDEHYELIAPDHSYARDENPVYGCAEDMLRLLEEGEDALLFASGMAAASAVFQALGPGDRVVAPTVMYWGLRHWLVDFANTWGLVLDFYDPDTPGDLENVVEHGERTRIVWMETPCNPTWTIVDIAEGARVAHAIGAKLVVDSTVATPVLTRPLALGADIVMHSGTKYLNGHGDVVAGALVCRTVDALWERIREIRIHAGAVLGSFEAWLLQRGMRTLFLRVQKASESALAIARHFESHPKLVRVLYPGLESHPRHDVACAQMSGGFGGMLSFRIHGGREKALAVAGGCQVFIRATSLGGVESLIEHRYSIEGASSPIPEDLLRLSVGVERCEDLIADLEQSLNLL